MRFAALGSANFRLYALCQTFGQSALWVQRTAQAWLVLELTGSPAAVGVVSALQFLPILVLGLFVGVMADRLPKRRVIMGVQSATVVQAVVMAVLVLAGSIQLWQIYTLAFVLGCLAVLENTSRHTLIAEMVDRDQMQSAVSLNSTASNSARVLGPMLAGVTIATLGIGWAFALQAAFVGIVLLGYFLMDARALNPSAVEESDRGLLGHLVDGLRYIPTEPVLLLPLLLQIFIGTLLINWTVVTPLLARFVFDAGPVGLGALTAAHGIGAVVGALVLAGMSEPGPRRVMLLGLGFTAAFLALAYAPLLIVGMLVLLGLGACQVAYQGSNLTTIQLRSRPDYRGRVLSVYLLLTQGTTPIGGACIGFMAEAWGIQVAMTVAGVVCLFGISGVWLLMRRRLSLSAPGAA